MLQLPKRDWAARQEALRGPHVSTQRQAPIEAARRRVFRMTPEGLARERPLFERTMAHLFPSGPRSTLSRNRTGPLFALPRVVDDSERRRRHGSEETNGTPLRQRCGEESRQNDERAEARDAALRTLWEKSDEPQAKRSRSVFRKRVAADRGFRRRRHHGVRRASRLRSVQPRSSETTRPFRRTSVRVTMSRTSAGS